MARIRTMRRMSSGRKLLPAAFRNGLREHGKMRFCARRTPAMNAPHAPSLLATVELAPRDPILGVTEAFVADPNPRKVNLGVGVYVNDEGKVPLLECVHRAERQLTA